MFSKLDANSRFLQIKLDEKSSFLTTLNIPVGRFSWLCFPFGISVPQECFIYSGTICK